jgi:hypothetical protein
MSPNKEEKPKKLIKYLGEEMLTTHFSDISEEKRAELEKLYFQKPQLNELHKSLIKIKNGSNITGIVERYYFRDLMSKVMLDGLHWTIEEVFQSRDVLGILYSFISVNDKVFSPDEPEIKKIETALRIGPSVTQKPSNYPLGSVRDILKKYDINGNYCDYSCGWGVRLLGSLATGLNYYGIDPNNLLTERLQDLAKEYKKVNSSSLITDIRTQGSEIFIPEWENTMGVAFTSPPYFSYEDYRVGEGQSFKENETSYEDWLNGYWLGTVKNIHKYLIKGGAFLVNIQNIKIKSKMYKLQDDCKKIAEENGFVQVDTHRLKVIARPTINANKELDSDEDIMVFAKIGETLKIREKELDDEEW